MIKTPSIAVVKTHCFISEPTALDLTNIPGIRPPESFIVQEFQMDEHELLDLPERPPGCAREGFRTFISLGQNEYADEGGDHIYSLSELRPSVVSLIAHLTADQIEPFSRRWSTQWIYAPFQGWEHVSREEALRICQEKAFQRLFPFLLRFQPLCGQAVTEWKGVYFLREHHFLYPAVS